MTKHEKEIILKDLEAVYRSTLHPMEAKRAYPIYDNIKSLAMRLGITVEDINCITEKIWHEMNGKGGEI